VNVGFQILVALAATVAGGIASIAGFGIGSILTPLLAAAYGTKLAVAVVSVPHLLVFAGLMGLTGLASRMRFGGIVFGTIAGQPVLRRIPPATFRMIVSGIILLLGVRMLVGKAVSSFGL